MASGSWGGGWGGSKTVFEEIKLDPSQDSSKKTQGGYTLSGDNPLYQFSSMRLNEDIPTNPNLFDSNFTYSVSAPIQTSTRVHNVQGDRTPPRKTSDQTQNRPNSAQLKNTSTQPRGRPTSKQLSKTSTPITSGRLASSMLSETRTPITSGGLTSSMLSETSWPPRYPPFSSLLRGTNALIPNPRAINLETVLSRTRNKNQVLNHVRRRFPELRKFMKKSFPGNSFELSLREVNFEKVQKDFSEVFRLRELIHLGESVCVLYVGDIRSGSGFVLVGNTILTNAHLLSGVLSEDRTTLTVPVIAVFNYEKKPAENNYLLVLEVHGKIIDLDQDMDYAVLRLINTENKQVPPGLLPHFGPKPDDGGACIIGHPGNTVKKIDLTFIIGKNEREVAANQHLESYDDFTRWVIVKHVKEQGINAIWCSDAKADLVITYKTSVMFHGSSGSPLFDREGRVVGLHSAGFTYDYNGEEHSVIEFAHSVMDIFKRYVYNIGTAKNYKLLNHLVQNSGDNPYLREIFSAYGLV